MVYGCVLGFLPAPLCLFLSVFVWARLPLLVVLLLWVERLIVPIGSDDGVVKCVGSGTRRPGFKH